ncbi:hypothetical protein BDV12DRAFT_189091 [Aspergillus spectabilis]
MASHPSAPSLETRTSALNPLSPDADLHLPRILCLHGGGTNSRIFHAQCRSISSSLKGHFRLIFAEAPFISGPGPDVESVYAEWGPFRSWVRPTVAGAIPVVWGPESVDAEAVNLAISNAINADDSLGATGRVVGLLGFSQGARKAACILLRQQHVNAKQNRGDMHTLMRTTSRIEYKFAVLFAGRGPLVALGKGHRDGSNHLVNTEQLQLPTIHVHGRRDPGLSLHQALLHEHCAMNTTRLIEWDGNHRVPIKNKDVKPVIAAILDTAAAVGLV